MTDDLNDLDVQLTGAESGDSGGLGPLVFVRQDVLQEVEAHAQEDLNNETGGILIGTAASSAEGTLVAVEAAIPALHTDASRGSVTFTHDTWEHINRIKDRDFPDKRIVGWYHTHPGFGLFLSEYDKFIQRSFFDLPWQVAFVTDPRAQQSGVFVWSGESLQGPRSFEVFGPAPVANEAAPATAARQAPSALPTWRLLAIMASVAAVALLVALVWSASGFRRADSMAPDQRRSLALAPPRTQAQLAPPPAPAAKPAPPPPAVEPPRPAASPQTTYTVKRGDSLWRIAKVEYGNGAKWGAIAVANGIEADDLEPGMVLKIPTPPTHEGEHSGDD